MTRQEKKRFKFRLIESAWIIKNGKDYFDLDVIAVRFLGREQRNAIEMNERGHKRIVNQDR